MMRFLKLPFMKVRRAARNGASSVQAGVVLALVAAVVIVGIRGLGQNTATDMNATGSDLADPAALADRFDHE